ncbi:immunoglobulin omega chain-like [Myripristis murdjan]|uniref:immunoglobulin omega chain-like n=1 Tax=Myripristis murdjan TaxID=586833 RepID=UPI001175DAB9|nr:immunoglobulin omega chain-like [Myripristis murdjan]
MAIHFALLLLSALVGDTFADDVTAIRAEVYSSQGRSVTLSCNYSIKAQSLQWYRQYPGSAPQFLLLITDTTTPDEGSTVTLSYKYSEKAGGNDYFFWYRQDPGKPPEFLLSIAGYQDSAELLKSDPRISTKLSEDKRGVDLEISSAAVTHSALYYCASPRFLQVFRGLMAVG